ncbi:hypothetical protein [Clavibacter zhangzhiyongii]|uniref:hypothetical protein n=1 Tax=Clavibacter zhangzhiyongii TaxID=2768071 RepID=UPI00195C69D5|nr:hypothetical protein [Clavibacter zhangzhiyongii]MBM7024986.1 hypothetical protein [Clavibacter zhangzhiyongii]
MNDSPQMHPARVDAVDDMLRGVLHRDERRARRAPRRRIAWLLVPLAAGGGIFMTASSSRSEIAPVTDQSKVACFSRAEFSAGNMDFPGTYVETLSQPGADGISGRVQQTDPVGLCTSMWEQGMLNPAIEEGSSHNDFSTVTATPELTVCVLPSGTAAVLPGGNDTCARVGLSRAQV